MVENGRGRALIDRQGVAGTGPLDLKQYRYRVIDGQDPLAYTSSLRETGLLDGGFHDGRAWLEATSGTERPDVVVQLAELFDSRRAGDLNIFAAEGWDFSPEGVGGHGGVTAAEMLVPMVIVGPGIKAGGEIELARTVDVAPTVVEMLAGERVKEYSFDGRSLLEKLRDQ